MRSIRHKNALVTGAATGLGRAIALRLAREGVHLYLLDVNEPGLASVVSAAKSEGVNAFGHYCDVSQPTHVTRSVADALARWGKIDILVNNAGITYYGDTEKMSATDADRLLAINLHAPIQFTRELLPTLLAGPEAHVLNVASFFGLVGTRKLALYTASKFGLVGFSESLRAEYGRRGLGVTALCPGFVDTNLFDTAPLGTDRQENKRPPKWMLTTPEKIADRAVKSIYRNRAVDVAQLYARLTYYGKRFFPGLLDRANHLSRKKKQSQVASICSEKSPRKAA
jgi:3-oxoacyl-[acyl-carrier protein] reductase